MFITQPRTALSFSNRKLVFDIGINDADYMVNSKDSKGTRYKCPFYVTWKSMLQRCYDPALQTRHATYVGCTTQPEWLYFSKFKKWMEKQDWQGKHLDKDLLVPGNKHYGSDTCLFLSPLVNGLLCHPKLNRGDLPLGVSIVKKREKIYYCATCSMYGKQKHIGYFSNAEDASRAYVAAKIRYIQELASKESNPKIAQALLNLPLNHSFV